MAQELSDKIRAAAQAKGIDPEIALRIARAESAVNPAAQAKTSSAGGLFQVVDKTWKEFGGKPGKKYDPDENIRVGTDIIAKNTQTLKSFLNRDPRPAEVYAAHYFGPTGAKSFLSAEPGTPMESIFSKEVIRANPNLKGKTTAQVMASLEKKMGSSPAAPAPARQANVSRETAPQKFLEPNPLEPLAPAAQAPLAPANKLASLGPGYQAALALSFLADTDEKEDRDIEKEPGIAEKWLAESTQASRPAALAEFSDISIKSPFAALEPKQPQMLADGGEVEEESAPDVGRPTVSETQLAKVMFPDLPVAEAVYLIRGGQRQSTPMGEMLSGNIGAMVPMGKDASAMLMLAGSRPERSMSESKALMAAFNKRVGDEGGLDINVVRPLDAPPGIFAGGMSASYPLGEGRISGNINALKLPGQDPRITGYGVGYGGRVGPGNLSAGLMKQKDGPYSGQIEYRLPIGRADGSPEEGERALTPQQIERLAEKEAMEREAASKPAFLTPKSGKGRQISTQPGELEAAALQGVSEYPYNLAGGFVDMATMAMRPFGYDVEKPMFGSEDLKQRATDLGIRQKPPEGAAARALYEMTQLGASAVNPAAPVRGAVAAAEKTGEAAKMLARDFQQYNRQISVPGASYAAKPKGGTFAYTPNDPNKVLPITGLGKMLQYYGTSARHAGVSDEIAEFLKTKAPKYFTTTYGTANDPLRTAFRERRIQPFGTDIQSIKPELIDAANRTDDVGNLQARIDLERAYDNQANITANMLKPENPPWMLEQDTRNALSEKIGQEGVTAEFRNPALLNAYSKSDFEEFPSGSEMLRRLSENQDKLPPNIQRALQTAEPMYDTFPLMEVLQPHNVIEALQQVPANKLKNMSFPEALIQGTQALAPVRDYLLAVDLAEKGAKVPRQALDRFTTPVMGAPSFGGKWVTIDDSLGTRMEGRLMNHSVGDYGSGTIYGTTYTDLPYGGKKAFDEGLVRVYSLRDAEGLPKVTLEMAKSDGGKGNTWNVTQIRGRFNSEPLPETRNDIFSLLDKIDGQDGLNTIKHGSYSKLPTGETKPRTVVDWAEEYDLYKQSAE